MLTSTLLLALAITRLAIADVAVVHNYCPYPIYLWSVSDVSGPMETIQSNKNYTETYHVNPNGGGISIKLSKTTAQATITQFEYTLGDGSKLWFDLSNVNGAPFAETDLLLESPNGSCETVVCPAGQTTCKEAYTNPHDDFATHECDASANLVLSVCASAEHVQKALARTIQTREPAADDNEVVVLDHSDISEAVVATGATQEPATEIRSPRHVHAHVARRSRIIHA